MLACNLWRCKTRCGEALVDPRRPGRGFIMFGVPGWAWAAHVMLLGTIGIEGGDHELPHEIDDLLEQAGVAGTGRFGPDGWIEKRHNARLIGGHGFCRA